MWRHRTQPLQLSHNPAKTGWIKPSLELGEKEREGERGRKTEREGANPEAERKKVAHRREIERKKRDTSEFATPRKHYF